MDLERRRRRAPATLLTLTLRGASREGAPREATATVRRVSEQPPPVCHIVGFGDSSIDFILRFWIRDPSNGITNIRGDVYLALWDALKANEIEIPFPRRDVTILNDGA